MDDIYSALNNKCDDTEQFFSVTREIASNFSSKLNCYCDIERWGNYTYSDKITLFFNNGQPCTSKPDMHDYDRALSVFLSARAPYYTFINYLCKKANVGIEWIECTDDSLPTEIKNSIKTITTILNNNNLQLLNRKQLLEQMAEGHYTELDSVPATVFDVLFGEII